MQANQWNILAIFKRMFGNHHNGIILNIIDYFYFFIQGNLQNSTCQRTR